MLVSKDKSKELTEKSLRLIFEQSPYGIQVFDSEGTCIEVNEAWEKLWGLKKEELGEYNILKDRQLMDSPVGAKLIDAYQGKRVHVPPHYYEPSKAGRPGRARWVQAMYYPIVDDNKKVVEVIVTLIDVTVMKQTEEKLREKNEELKFINDAMVGRELKMVELKHEIERLKNLLSDKKSRKGD